jgi:hypothetical protein
LISWVEISTIVLLPKSSFRKSRVRTQLEVHIGELMSALGVDDKAVASELGINLAHVQRLRDDSWTTIKRSELQKLLCWGHKHGHAVLSVQPSPVWRTLPGSEVCLLRGTDRSGNALASDSMVESKLLEELSGEGCRVRIVAGPDVDESSVRDLMKSKNCIFIGSPKHNRATEIALAALWDLSPFDPREGNRKKSPILFRWEPDKDRRSAFDGDIHGSVKPGIYVSVAGRRGQRSLLHVPADWRSTREYSRWTGRGRDAGVLVVCNRPLGTDQDVTSIVLAGFSGFATLEMTADLVGDGLRIESNDARPGVPTMRILVAPYRKSAARRDSRVRISKGRRWIAPPWTQLARLAATASSDD